MNYKNYFSFLLLVGAVLLFGARAAHACSCGPSPTVLESYEAASNIVILRAISVEKTEKAAPDGQIADDEHYVDGVKSTKMLVEKVYKGTLKAGDEITFGQGGGADCVWTFNEKSIGRQFLFYLHSKEKNPKLWYGFGCGRSRGLEHATDDLLYLNKLDKVSGKTRISGTVVNYGDGDWSIEGRRIRIIGAKKTYEVKTDKHGVYEIYDLPAGKYLIEPEVPTGWQLNQYYLRDSSSFLPDEQTKEGEVLKQVPIMLEEKKHAALDFHFEIDTTIRGKLYDPDGKPMKGVCIKAVQPDGQPHGYNVDCTDENGAFAITRIPPGSYVLAVNDDGKISSSEPFKTFYYPNVFALEKATVVEIGAGDHLDGFNIYVPRLEETVMIQGRLLYSDGKPVVDESVKFSAGKTKDNIKGDVSERTDAKGNFSLRVLKGLEGELSGEMWTYAGEFENCPKLEAIIKQSSGTFATIKTELLKIQSERDLKELELRFPFAGCKKAKSPQGEKPER
ncbi:MAG TPA: carboxypeptidase regulatory-like domain-containing protein [Pyrinomonadaceae bacterium]|nr:carboxypeptidase regulatory-like domain-containing protein [Pyrinomonadaceae bacterium]